MNCILNKRWYVLMAMLVLTIFCVTVSAQAAEEKIHIRATCNVPPGDLMGDTMGQFLKILKEKSGGKVTYEMHAGGVLGFHPGSP